jgi:hypothetical protein
LIGIVIENNATGIKTMAAILQFEPRTKNHSDKLPPDHSAQILMYTGVRFERIDFEAVRHNQLRDSVSETASPARLAN